MTTSPGIGVVPDARRAVKGTPVCSTRLVVGENLREEVGSVPFESLPGVLSALVEDVVERRGRHHLTARAAAVARVDEWELISKCAHKSLPDCQPRFALPGLSIWSLDRFPTIIVPRAGPGNPEFNEARSGKLSRASVHADAPRPRRALRPVHHPSFFSNCPAAINQNGYLPAVQWVEAEREGINVMRAGEPEP